MNQNQLFVLEIKEQLKKLTYNLEKKELLEKAVKELKTRGLSSNEIKELFKIVELKEQDNSLMVSNNARYLELLEEILNR
ncbi:MAG: hypothetical protein REI96_22095 [Flavobacterium nitrogenifigens]|uniref:hypothetical protein n=1 Tax=Flavobacterium nitrogenifigens TaxID=1617283 RepID=UPI002807D154|nr:hypothetical protein [Flavobacterium nitrogenifigens]MDQ8015154.1 hypothetical protein [Flavobacterium nitrogenifigens]